MNGKEKQEFIESLISDIDKTTDIRLRKNVYIYHYSKQTDRKY